MSNNIKSALTLTTISSSESPFIANKTINTSKNSSVMDLSFFNSEFFKNYKIYIWIAIIILIFILFSNWFNQNYKCNPSDGRKLTSSLRSDIANKLIKDGSNRIKKLISPSVRESLRTLDDSLENPPFDLN